jgi:PIN domain nuclease of toxin-antitoxin system
MRLVLDTHVWLWALLEPAKLSPAIRSALGARDNQILLSAVSLWEVLELAAKKRIAIDGDATAWIVSRLRGSPVQVVALTQDIIFAAHGLELKHKDPADRWIVATAQTHSAALATVDRMLLEAKAVEVVS